MDEYYDKESLEIVKMTNNDKLDIELDYSVLTDLTLVIEYDHVNNEERIGDIIANILYDIDYMYLLFKSNELKKCNVDTNAYDYIQKNKKNKNKTNIKFINDNIIEISIGLFNFNIFDNFDCKFIGFPLYLFKLMYINEDPLYISLYDISYDFPHYLTYKKYNVNNNFLTNNIYNISKFYSIKMEMLKFKSIDKIATCIIKCSMNEIDDNIYIFNKLYNIDDEYNEIIYIKIIYDDDHMIIYDNIENYIKYKTLYDRKYIFLKIKNHEWINNVKIIISFIHEVIFWTSYFSKLHCIDIKKLI